MTKTRIFSIPTTTYTMNLLVKKIGLVLLPALFFACEEPTELGTSLNPNEGALSTHYVEIPVTTSQVRIDSFSLFTATQPFSALRGLEEDGRAVWSPLYLGRIESSDFGVVKSSLYANLAKPDTASFTSSVRLDSVKFQLVWNNKNIYGKNLDQPQQFLLYQLESPIASTAKRTDTDNQGVTFDLLTYNYGVRNQQPLGKELGNLTLNVPAAFINNPDTSALNEVSTRIISTPLDPAEAQIMFDRFKQDAKPENYANGIFASQEAFDNFIKGIAVVPGDNNSFITTFDIANANSGLFFYYTQGTEQYQLRISFIPGSNTLRYTTYPVYFGLEEDRTGTGLANASTAGHLEEFQPIDQRVYFQPLSGILPKVEFNAFKDFLLTLAADEKIIINRAFLEFDSVLVGGKREPLPQQLNLFFVEDDNRVFPSARLAGPERAFSTVLGQPYKVGTTSVNYYRSDIAFVLEQFMQNSQDRYLQTILYPGASQSFRPNSFVVRPEQVKLKIWYTKLKGNNL